LICAGRRRQLTLPERGELPRRLALWGAAAKDEGAGGGEQQNPVAEPIATAVAHCSSRKSLKLPHPKFMLRRRLLQSPPHGQQVVIRRAEADAEYPIAVRLLRLLRRGRGAISECRERARAHLAQAGIALVYGGGRIGLMGLLADAALGR